MSLDKDMLSLGKKRTDKLKNSIISFTWIIVVRIINVICYQIMNSTVTWHKYYDFECLFRVYKRTDYNYVHELYEYALPLLHNNRFLKNNVSLDKAYS